MQTLNIATAAPVQKSSYELMLESLWGVTAPVGFEDLRDRAEAAFRDAEVQLGLNRQATAEGIVRRCLVEIRKEAAPRYLANAEAKQEKLSYHDCFAQAVAEADLTLADARRAFGLDDFRTCIRMSQKAFSLLTRAQRSPEAAAWFDARRPKPQEPRQRTAPDPAKKSRQAQNRAQRAAENRERASAGKSGTKKR